MDFSNCLPTRWVFASGAAAFLAFFAVGCSSMQVLPVETISPDGEGPAWVILRDGYSYKFERVLIRGDSLVGVYYESKERIREDGAVAYVDQEYETLLPRSKVTRVEVKRVDIGKTLLLGAGVTIAAVWLKGVLETDEVDVDLDGGKVNPL